MAEEPEVVKVVFPENLQRFKGRQDDYNDTKFSRKTHEVRAATDAEIDAALAGEVIDHG